MTTNHNRREFLSGVVTVAAVACIGLGTNTAALADWPKAAFDAREVDAALQSIAGPGAVEASTRIVIIAPPIAENGAVVGVSVETDLPGVDAIHLLAEKNAAPLVASFELAPATAPFVNTRIKIADTTQLIAVVRSEGRLYQARRLVKVTTPGCGGGG